MKPKKNPKVSLEGKRVLFFEIGLIAVLALSILVFNSGFKSNTDLLAMKDAGYQPEPYIHIPPPTVYEQKRAAAPAPARQIIRDVINIIGNDVKISTLVGVPDEIVQPDIVTSSDPTIATGTGIGVPIEEKPKEDHSVYLSVEKMPRFKGGNEAGFRKWVMENLHYPEDAIAAGIYGTVHVQFVVEKDGSVSNINILLSPDQTLSDEVRRVISSSPRWEPGMQNKMPVRVNFTIPIEFELR